MIQKKSCLIYLCLFMLSASSWASNDADYVVLFKKKPKHVDNLTRFTPYHSSYFDRLYQGKLSTLQLKKLQNLSVVEKIEPVYSANFDSIIPNQASSTEFDPLLKWQWGISNQLQSLTADIDDIHSERLTGVPNMDIGSAQILDELEKKMQSDVLVAVIDSGVDVEHPDLKDHIFKNMSECDSEGRVRFRPTDDRDQNGFIGDCQGWDFTKEGNKDGQRPLDEQGHGTHLAGIMTMSKGNSLGGRGVTDRIRILPIKVSHGGNGSGPNTAADIFTDRVAKGILYATQMGAKVINLSLGWPRSMDTDYLRQAFSEALKKNIIIVAAAGNNHSESPIFPCAYRGVICVGAISVDGRLADFSNYGGAVDILAPGDQILSTYPQKLTPSFFSVVGYEIKNGTSQAAPFISGLSAVLRGINPEMSLDGIKSILFSWGLKKDANQKEKVGESLFGLSRGNLDLTPSEFLIYPDFKEKEELEVSLADLSFSLSLNLQNMGADQGPVTVKVNISNPEVDLENDSFSLEEWKSGEQKSIELKGRAHSKQISSQIRLHLDVISGDKKLSFERRIILTRNFDGAEMRRLDLPSIGINYLLPQKKGFASQLRTVQDFFRASSTPEYYAVKTTPNASQLYLLRPNLTGSENKVSIVTAANPLVGRLLNFYQVDLNYDGMSEYLLVTLVQKDSDRYLLYTYLDHNLSPLFGDKSSLIFRPDVAVFDPAHMAILPVTTKFGTVATLAFMAEGKIPEIDKNPDPFVRDQNDSIPHFYYLFPDFEKGKIITRMVDNYLLRQKISERYETEWQEKIQLVGPLYQSQTLFQAHKAYLQLEIIDGLQIRRTVIELGKNFSTQIIDGPSATLPWSGQIMVPLMQLNAEGQATFFAGSAFISMQNDILGSASFYGQNGEAWARFKINHPLVRDHVIGLLAGARQGNTNYLFYQTKNNLVLIRQENGEQRTFLHGIDRVSFLPGMVFNELFYPVVSGDSADNSKLPSFYVDATQLNSGRIYVLKASENGLKSALESSISLSNKCLALNPVSVAGTYNFVALCAKEGATNGRPPEFEIRFLPVK